MMPLAAEKSQAGGGGNPDSEEDLDSTLNQDKTTLDTDDLSPLLPCRSVAVPSLKPVLNEQEILSDLESDNFSTSKLSVDVDCESVISDYSELGSPLRAFERDIHFMDRKTLKTDAVLFTSNMHGTGKECPVRQEEETETEFEWRVRKINLLSLAQEFAELKKIDSQACPINFHRNQSAQASFRGCHPLGSRGQSLERIGRRTQSKSPLRPSEKVVYKGFHKNIYTTNDDDMTKRYPTLSKNYDKQLLAKQALTHNTEDLPVNEARRRNSDTDLPANMRPQRYGNSPSNATRSKTTNLKSQEDFGNKLCSRSKQCQGSSDCEGDFEVYNIETALSNMNWRVLEEQFDVAAKEETNPLKICKNDREEILRRLAMTADEGFGDNNVKDSDPFSPRKQLQVRLPAGPSGMQICFLNEDGFDVDDGTCSVNETDHLETELPQLVEKGSESDKNESVVTHQNHPYCPGETEEFTSKQTQLQSEATLALAQASTMAQMQLEVDKQTKKKSPIADMVGIPTLGSGRRLDIKRSKLQEMNIAQLQVLVNDLHSQIELLNEDLVHLLIERDDLHMEQDSMLVDIEDLTRFG